MDKKIIKNNIVIIFQYNIRVDKDSKFRVLSTLLIIKKNIHMFGS